VSDDWVPDESDRPRVDESVLDDPAALEARDPGQMLRAVASAGAQIREGMLRLDQDAVRAVVADGRPRALVVAGMGGSGISGDVAAAVTGPSCPVPVLVSRGHRLPGWVGPMDLVIAVSASGETEETLAATDEAIRRGARVATIGRAGSALAQRAAGGHAVHLAVETGGRMPRASLWSLATPLLTVVDGLGLATVPPGLLAGVADRLDEISAACGPSSETYDNVAKRTALQLSGTLPHVWGASALAAVAALRFACQLAENAKQPAVHGALTEVHHNQIVALAGRYGAGARTSAEDIENEIFWDPLLDGGTARERMRLLLLRDTEELEAVAARCAATGPLAEAYGVVVDELAATGEHPLERLASLIAPLDFASVYLALLEGTDPTPIEPIVTLKKATAI
jgi:glucose/mannose-6-phosphate isomerase